MGENRKPQVTKLIAGRSANVLLLYCDQDMIQKCSKIQLRLSFGLLCLSLLE